MAEASSDRQAPAGAYLRPGVRARASALLSWRYFDTALLSLLVAAIVAVDMVWLSLDEVAPHWDYARHLGDSLVYYDTAFTWSDPLRPLQLYVAYPPFDYWLTAPFYAVFGREQWVAVLSNMVFLAILIFATYGIGRALWNRAVGLLSALFVVTTPMFVTMTREYMLDVPLSAMVTAAVYLLLRCDNFAGRGTSLLLGLTCGLGMLTKWTFPLYVALPILYALVIAAAHAARSRSPERIVNALGAGVLAFVVCAVWYLHNWAAFRAEAVRGSRDVGEILGLPPVSSLASVLWYFWNLLNNQLYLVPFVFFAIGVVYVFRRDDSASRNMIPILTIVGAYIGTTLLWNKNARYTMPMLPAVAVVATHWLTYLSGRIRQRLGAGLVAYCALAFVVISFGTDLLPREIRIPLPARSFTSDLPAVVPPESRRVTGIVLFAQHGHVVGKPRRENWHVEEAFREIVARGGTTFTFQYEDDTVWFNTWDVRYYALKHHLTWVGVPEAAGFMVIRTKHARVPFVPAGFVVRKAFPLPDGGLLWLFGRA